jgi:DNA-directed RNA polymerase subunit omega
MALSRHTLIEPPIETLLDKVDSKFTLVTLAARRGRQINAYYGSLGSEFGRVAPPQVTSTSEKALSIAFEEISAGKVGFVRVDPEVEAAELAAEAAALAAAEADAADFFAAVPSESAPTTEL